MCNKDKPYFDDQCKHAFGLKQEAHRRWTRNRSGVNWDEFVHCQVRANDTYSEAKRQFNDRNRDVLMNVHFPQKRWYYGSASAACSSGMFPGLLEATQCHPNSERSTVILCFQLPTDFHNISIVEPGVCASWKNYGTQWCASNHPVCFS